MSDPKVDLRGFLDGVRTIAVVGLSPKQQRDSHRVAAYLQNSDYRILPVYPCGGCEILGEKAYDSLADLVAAGERPDLVDVFRRPDAVPEIVDTVIAGGIPRLWLQLGVANAQAEARAVEAGVAVVSDRCLMVEHRRLLGG